jgi:ABC-type multidrug transport system fused ATPase/permease subunit
VARYSRNDEAGVELPKAKLDRESLRQAMELFRYLRPYRGRFSAALVALFASSLLSLAFPYLAGNIIDAAMLHTKASGSMAGADRTALLLMGILALQAGLSYFHSLSLVPMDINTMTYYCCILSSRLQRYSRSDEREYATQ